MANIAQMINVLQAMILTRDEKMLLTPTYYVFDLYKVYQDATSLPIELKSPWYSKEAVAVPAISASAARRRNCLASLRRLVFAIISPRLSHVRDSFDR